MKNGFNHYDNTFLNSVQSRVDSLTFQIKTPTPSIC